jgi:5-methyltetrahydropteroyltriglutamate--homocysteine methyltransferase
MPDETAQPGDIFDLTARKGPTPGDSTYVIPRAYDARIDVLNLETGGRRRDLSGLGTILQQYPLPKHVQYWAGVIDVKSTITETAGEVADRIRQVLQYVPADQLGLTTDCGLILLQRYIAVDKIHALVAGTKIVREELAQKSAAMPV